METYVEGINLWVFLVRTIGVTLADRGAVLFFARRPEITSKLLAVGGR